MRLLQTGCKHPAFPYGVRISLQNKTMHSWDRNIDTHIQVAYVLTIPSSGFTALSFASRTCSPGSCSSFFNPVSYSFQLLQPITFSPCEFSLGFYYLQTKQSLLIINLVISKLRWYTEHTYLTSFSPHTPLRLHQRDLFFLKTLIYKTGRTGMGTATPPNFWKLESRQVSGN